MIAILVTGTQGTLPVRLWAMMRRGFAPGMDAPGALILAVPFCVVAAGFLVPARATTVFA